MHITIKNLLKISEDVKQKLPIDDITYKSPKIIAVSKTFKIDHIKPLIEHGHLDFGENKVQEAIEKWSEIKKVKKDLKLHLIGRLQTNKVKTAIQIFDYIHSVDSKKLADRISKYQNQLNVKTKLFIQVNVGNEDQKSGISKSNVIELYNYCKKIELDVVGLMCIPPFGEDTEKYFKEMKNLNDEIGLSELSMGMSSDYINAAESGSTYLRIGSNIFGKRG